jgi:RNA polymerase sigma-70 factor (ECF subfamily)
VNRIIQRPNRRRQSPATPESIRIGASGGQKNRTGTIRLIPAGLAMSNDDPIRALAVRLRSGEDAAAREVFEQFAGRLVALARRQFNGMLARKVDPEDVVQSAFKSFFIRHRDGKVEIVDGGGLWNLLTLITLRKCADRAEYFRASRRDAAREATGPRSGDRPDAGLIAVDREPRPEEAVILAETVEQLFRDLTADERPVLEMSLQGYTAPEISDRLGRAERSVRRLRERIRKRLERLQETD